MNTGDINIISDLTAPIIDKINDNIMLNAFRVAINGSLTQFNMVDGIVDEYEDESAVLHLDTPFCHMALEDNTDDGTGANAVSDIGTPTYTSGHLNNALTLDGSTDALNVDALQADIISDTTGSIAFWVKIDGTTTGMVFSLGDTNANTFFHLSLQSTERVAISMVQAGADKATGRTDASSYTPDEWLHVVVVQNGTEPVIYINGVLSAITWSGSVDLTWWFSDYTGIDNGRIGCNNFNSAGNAEWVNGQIDDFRYYQNTVLTQAQVDEIYNSGTGTEDSEIGSQNISYDSVNDLYSPLSSGGLTTSPYTHYKCNDDAANTTVTDDGSGANNGAGNVNTSNYSVAGKINDAFDFNGTTEYINLDALAPDIDTDVTGSFSMWINPTELALVGSFLTFGDTDGSNFIGVWTDAGNKLNVGLYASGYLWRHSDAVATITAEWQHIVIVHDGISPKIYRNGVDITNFTVTSDLTAWFSNFSEGILDNGRLGTQNWGGGGNTAYFKGAIDDVRYYQNKALTQDEIDELYNAGSGSEDDQFPVTIENITLISEDFTAEAQADTARIVLFEEDIDAVTINTDLLAYASRDAGTTYSQITLEDQGDYETGKRILSASVDISGQPAGTSMRYKLVTANNKDLNLHGSSLSWD